MSDLNNILSQSDCLSKEQLQAYLNKSIDKDTMHAYESHLIDCMFCSDALEGLQILPAEENVEHIGEIKANIESLLHESEEKVVPLKTETPEKSILTAQKGGKRISWAAAAGLFFLIFGSGLVVFSYINRNTDWFKNNNELVNNEIKTEDVKLEESKNSGRELDRYTLDETDLNNEVVAKADKQSEEKVSRKTPIKSASEVVKKSDPIIAQNNRTIQNSPAQLPKPKVANEEIAAFKKENEKATAETIAKVDTKIKEASDFENAGARNTYTQPLYDGKLKDINKDPSSVKTSSSGKKKTSSKYIQQEADKRYLDAIQSSGDITSTKSRGKIRELDNYTQALNAFNMGKYKESIKYFKKELKNKDSKKRDETMFLLAQAYEKTNNTRKAKALYEQLSQSATYKKQAESGLKRMQTK